jgi:hypothetical protein
MSSLVVSDPIARIGQLKNCPVCERPVSLEEAACAKCGVLVHPPSHADFPPAVKWFALWEYARANRWHSWVSEQELWTNLVREIVNGSRSGFSRPNPFGLPTSAPIEQCLPLVIPIATAWRAANAPFTQQQFRLSA